MSADTNDNNKTSTPPAQLDEQMDNKSDIPDPLPDQPEAPKTKPASVESKSAKPEVKPDPQETLSNKPEVKPVSSETLSSKSDATPEKTDTKPPKQKPAVPQAPGSSKGGGGILRALTILFLLLAIAGMAAGGYWFYNMRDSGGELEQRLSSQQQSIIALENQLEESQLQQLQREAGLKQLMGQLQLSVSSQANRLQELSTTTRSDWLLAEAEYLIRLGNQRLITERNTRNATALLEAADQILRDLDEVGLFPVRQALAEDITALKMVKNVDREGLFLQLNALSKQLQKLPLIQKEAEVSETPVDETVAVDLIESVWRDKLEHSFRAAVAAASELIRVRRRDAPIEPLLSPDEEVFLRNNLGSMMEQAQLALLREEQAVYQVSLEKAHQWLGDYFELSEGAGVVADELLSLGQLQVVQGLPDISGALEALRDYVDQWHKRHTVAEAGAAQ